MQRRTDTILQASPDAIVVSADGEFVYANAAAADLYGVDTDADLLGREVDEFIHPDYRDDIDRQLRQVEAGDRPIDYIPRTLLTLEGEEIPVEVTARHIVWEDDPSVLAIVRDLTRQEEHVRRQARYEGAFERAFDAMVVADDDGRYIEVNRSACELFGLEKSELLGRRIEEFAPDDYDVEAAWREFEASGTDRGTFELVRDDGERRTVEYAATADIVPGEHLSVLRDVSEQENREWVLREMYNVISDRGRPFDEQVRALLELGREELDIAYGTLSQFRGEDYVFEVVDSADDSVQEGDVVPLSATNCEIAASTRETLVLGDVARDAPGETDRAGYADWGIECYLGAPVFVDDEVYGTFCFYGTEPRDGQFSEWEVTLVDLMSRWVSYELQRERTNARLKEQNDKLERFASIVSHDLRNPLNVLEGALDLARETGDDEHFETCRRAVDRMNALIDDLLALSRVGSAIDETAPVALGDLAERCWRNVETGSASLRVEAAGTVRADESRLQQLLENLIRNAVEHGGESITVTIGDLDDGFYVEDDGPGIPPDDRDEVFESGYTTAPDGTGFGLAIVEGVVEAHGWDVELTEGSAGGARFEIHVPPADLSP